ncbi:MAG: NADPH-dependent glutamate synthase [Bacteroidales bacterium]|jgi:glutamate synthase (NADPH/NADH) small chain|nr:NADPH-dependent glutamate synthase [Bacteroidales bacterium]
MRYFEIITKERLSEQIVSMYVYAPRIAAAALPGQFLIVVPDERGERVPLTICEYDREKGIIRIVFQVVGNSTRKMEQFQTGDTFSDIVGPLGRPSEFTAENWAEVSGRNILFVAGSVAAAPVYPQVKWMKERGKLCDVIIGARSANLMVLEKEMREVAADLYLCTDDGTLGFNGRVDSMIKELIDVRGKKYDEIICVGPMIMMKTVAALAQTYKIKTIVSLNSLMVDGTGMCGACRVTVDKKVKFTCVDGPEFDGSLVDFDEAMKRSAMYRQYEIGEITPEHTCNLAAAINEAEKVNRETYIKSENERIALQIPKALSRINSREQEPNVRNKNFDEVNSGFTFEEAVSEAKRCLHCKKPRCVDKCPVSVKIPQFIGSVAQGDIEEAARIIAIDSALPAVCGRVCPQETQCEGDCVLGVKSQSVNIGKLERFVADYMRQAAVSNITNTDSSRSIRQPAKKVAVIGSGPAGLTCAGDLAKMGYSVTVFEALHKAGGVLVYGIPEFRLPKSVVAHEIENLKALGVAFETDVIIGKTLNIDTLLDKEGYAAVFIGSGAGLPKFMHIKGEELNGVLSANELLTRTNLMKAYLNDYDTPVFKGKKVAVVGGGNVAMDAARVAKRLGSDVYIVYRRTEDEMPARKEEIHHAHEEGIHFLELTNPVEILGDDRGWVRGMVCVKMRLGEPDASGRRSPVEIPDSEFELETDEVIMALGTSPNPVIARSTEGLQTERWGGITADENGVTTRKNIFAGGDAVSGAATVILAMGMARKAAREMDRVLNGSLS